MILSRIGAHDVRPKRLKRPNTFVQRSAGNQQLAYSRLENELLLLPHLQKKSDVRRPIDDTRLLYAVVRKIICYRCHY